MFRFFRTIRKQLFIKNSASIQSNKLRKYLLYAIGEIGLVVIGILIALQVNNLNENRKSSHKEKAYLVSMQNELTSNLEMTKKELNSLTNSIEGQRRIIELINTKNTELNENELTQLIAVCYATVFELSYQDGTFKELLYSGGLISIKNDSIKHEVTSWEGRMIDIRKQEKGVYDAREKIINFMIDKGVFKLMLDDFGASDQFQIKKSIRRTDVKSIIESQRLENLVSYHFALSDSQKAYYERLIKDINNLLKMVEKELDNR